MKGKCPTTESLLWSQDLGKILLSGKQTHFIMNLVYCNQLGCVIDKCFHIVGLLLDAAFEKLDLMKWVYTFIRRNEALMFIMKSTLLRNSLAMGRL